MFYFLLGLIILMAISLLWIKVTSYKVVGVINSVATRTIIFDFDGTLCDSHAKVFETLNVISSEYGFRRVEASEVESLRNLDTKAALSSLGIKRSMLPFVVHRLRKELRNHLDKLTPFPGMAQLMHDLKANGADIGIVTSNSAGVVNFLEKYGVRSSVGFIVYNVAIFAKGAVFRKIKNHCNQSRIIYVCDETRDVNAALEEGLRVIPVSWGYNSRKALEALGQDKIADTTDQLRDYLRNFHEE